VFVYICVQCVQISVCGGVAGRGLDRAREWALV